MRRLIWTVPARTDLRDIRSFYLAQNPATGARFLRAIMEKARLLETFPSAGPVFEGAIRILLIRSTPYAVQYRITERTVQILRIRHEREDWR